MGTRSTHKDHAKDVRHSQLPLLFTDRPRKPESPKRESRIHSRAEPTDSRKYREQAERSYRIAREKAASLTPDQAQVTTDNTVEFDLIMARARAGEFHVFRMTQGETNAQWIMELWWNK